MTKHFTFIAIDRVLWSETNRYRKEYVILFDGDNYEFVTGYKNAVKECQRLEKVYKRKAV